jgi:hypothetical protein
MRMKLRCGTTAGKDQISETFFFWISNHFGFLPF